MRKYSGYFGTLQPVTYQNSLRISRVSSNSRLVLEQFNTLLLQILYLFSSTVFPIFSIFISFWCLEGKQSVAMPMQFSWKYTLITPFRVFRRNSSSKLKKKKLTTKISFEPDSNQRPKDTFSYSTVLRSTNWAIEGTTLRRLKFFYRYQWLCDFCQISAFNSKIKQIKGKM